ncbi:hypothetical protein DB41_AE00130 [Neochlamydia sp. TUME1]|nr:hypothetical protein DB41_AE00130 [Neochlamydia sp. TUME1]
MIKSQMALSPQFLMNFLKAYRAYTLLKHFLCSSVLYKSPFLKERDSLQRVKYID